MSVGNKISIPRIISPCPLADAVIEIKFDSKIDSDAVFGILYNAVKDSYPKINKLPILQLPEPLRVTDPNLAGQPHYQLVGDPFVLQIGPKVISLDNPNQYVGWEILRPEAINIFNLVRNLNIVEKVNRFGLRYVNFFDGIDIFEKIDLKVTLRQEEFKKINKFLRVEIPSEEFMNLLQVSNHANLIINGKSKNGSIIDIDTHTVPASGNFFEAFDSLLDRVHEVEKGLFFNLLKPEFLETLNPEY